MLNSSVLSQPQLHHAEAVAAVDTKSPAVKAVTPLPPNLATEVDSPKAVAAAVDTLPLLLLQLASEVKTSVAADNHSVDHIVRYSFVATCT